MISDAKWKPSGTNWIVQIQNKYRAETMMSPSRVSFRVQFLEKLAAKELIFPFGGLIMVLRTHRTYLERIYTPVANAGEHVTHPTR